MMERETLRQKLVRGYKLTWSAFKLVLQQKSLLIVPVVWFVVWCALLAGYLYWGLAMRIEAEGSNAWSIPWHITIWTFLLLPVLYLSFSVINVTTLAVISDAVTSRLDGRPMALHKSIQSVVLKRRQLFAYALLNSGFGVLGSALGWVPVIGPVLVGINGSAWTTANAFAVPILMDKDVRVEPFKSTVLSVKTAIKSWREGVAVKSTIGLTSLLLLAGSYAVFMVVAQGVFAVFGQTQGVVAAVAIVGTLVMLLECLVLVQFSIIVRTVLYQYIKRQDTYESFDKQMLRATITTRGARKIFA